MNDFDQFERRLAAAVRADADVSVGPFEAGAVAHAAIAGTQPRATRFRGASSRLAGRSGRGRGVALLAAAALLLIGGMMAAGSGLRLPSVVPPVPAPSFGVVVAASPDATSPSTSDSPDPTAGPTASPLTYPTDVWIPTGTMSTPRNGHTMVRLLDGRVLVAGGWNGETALTSAELYDPTSGTWSATGNMLKALAGFPATLLPDGKVLVGGVDDAAANEWITGAEVYDPESGTWSSAGELFTTEGWLAGTTATSLRDGKVLVAGQNGARLYEPASGTWSATGKMITPRHHHTATLLPDGKVIVAGGTDGHDGEVYSAELYDPDTGSWTAIADTLSHGGPCRAGCPRGGGMATLLQDGTMLYMRLGFVEIYDPATGSWTETGKMLNVETSATLLLDGTVLVAGGQSGADPASLTAEVYDPATRSWTKTGSMLGISTSGHATLLLDGTVLVAGGEECEPGSGCWASGSAEIYVPAGVSPPPAVVALRIPSPTPRPTPTPIPTPIPPEAGPIPAGARSWTVTVVNKSSKPGTLFLAEEGENGVDQLCGSVTPNVVPAGVTEKVTFLLPAKSVKSCWIWVNPVPGLGGSMFQTSDAPMTGKFVIQEGEHGPQGAWSGQ